MSTLSQQFRDDIMSWSRDCELSTHILRDLWDLCWPFESYPPSEHEFSLLASDLRGREHDPQKDAKVDSHIRQLLDRKVKLGRMPLKDRWDQFVKLSSHLYEIIWRDPFRPEIPDNCAEHLQHGVAGMYRLLEQIGNRDFPNFRLFKGRPVELLGIQYPSMHEYVTLIRLRVIMVLSDLFSLNEDDNGSHDYEAAFKLWSDNRLSLYCYPPESRSSYYNGLSFVILDATAMLSDLRDERDERRPLLDKPIEPDAGALANGVLRGETIGARIVRFLRAKPNQEATQDELLKHLNEEPKGKQQGEWFREKVRDLRKLKTQEGKLTFPNGVPFKVSAAKGMIRLLDLK